MNRILYMKALIYSFHSCDFKRFFLTLSDLAPSLFADWIFKAQFKNYIIKIRCRVLSQFLWSYKAVRLTDISATIGHSNELLERELNMLIIESKLNCKIDRVDGI